MTAPRSRRYLPLISIAVVLAALLGLYFVVTSLPLEILWEIRRRPLNWSAIPLIVVVQLVFMIAGAEIWRRVVRSVSGSQLDLLPHRRV